MPETIEWQTRPPRRRRLFLILALIAVFIFGGRTTLSYYVDALWFASLGYGDVFRKTLSFQWAVFAAFFGATFFIVYGWFLALRRAYQPDLLGGGLIFISAVRLKLEENQLARVIE